MAGADAEQTYRGVMTVEPSSRNTPFAAATRDFVFGEFSAYYGFAEGQAWSDAVEAAWAARPGRGATCST